MTDENIITSSNHTKNNTMVLHSQQSDSELYSEDEATQFVVTDTLSKQSHNVFQSKSRRTMFPQAGKIGNL